MTEVADLNVWCLQVADELANVVAEDGVGSPRLASPPSKQTDAQTHRLTVRRQSVALEVDGLAKLQAGLQQAPEQVAAAKSVGDAALKALTATPELEEQPAPGANAVQADLVSARSDPLWQYLLRQNNYLEYLFSFG